MCAIDSKKSDMRKVETYIQSLFKEDIDLSHVRNKFICDSCVNTLASLSMMRLNIARACSAENAISPGKTFQGKRRLSPTCIQPRKKISVSEQIMGSVEKLKSGTNEDKEEKNACRKLVFDHVYSKKETYYKVPDILEEDILLDVKDPVINSEIVHTLNDEISKIVRGRKSVLLKKEADVLKTCNYFSACVIEMNESCPLLLHVLSVLLGSMDRVERKIATIATIYGMLMHSRDPMASGIQRIYSSLAIRFHADNKLMQKLNKVHVTMSSSSKPNLVREFGDDIEENLVKDLSKGLNGKLNGDNVDLRVNTNDIRMANSDKSYHFFASNFVIDRVKPLNPHYSGRQTYDNIKIEDFLPNVNETDTYKESLKVLLSRIIIGNMQGFQWLSSVIPDHISHLYEEEMAKPSIIHPLPLSLNSECSYDGCLKILQEYTDIVNRCYRKAGRANELEQLKVPVGGDQLTRVRFQGAKCLRAGCHTTKERLEQLDPIIIELFHTLQDFLEKLCKKFLKVNSRKDIGTLGHLKMLLQRSNVNGNVKSRFKAHEDFVLCMGDAYFLSYMVNKFKLTDLNDKPVHDAIPDNISNLHKTRKTAIYNTILNEIIEELFIPFKIQEESKISVNVTVQDGMTYKIQSVITQGKATVPIVLGPSNFQIQIPVAKLKLGCKICVKGVFLNIKEDQLMKDDFNNYVVNFLQWFFVIIQLKDTIHEGDITRTNIILKTMIPFFYSHSVFSKYFTECIDYILKTELTLPPGPALRVRAASFVNVHGGAGKNKAADLHKENEVKVIKDLVRGLGANKTEKSIIAISKAAPVIDEISKNFDKMLAINEVNTCHNKRTSEKDVSEVLKTLQKMSVWDKKERPLHSFNSIKKNPFSFDIELFKNTIRDTVERLMRDIPIPNEDDTDESDSLASGSDQDD